MTTEEITETDLSEESWSDFSELLKKTADNWDEDPKEQTLYHFLFTGSDYLDLFRCPTLESADLKSFQTIATKLTTSFEKLKKEIDEARDLYDVAVTEFCKVPGVEELFESDTSSTLLEWKIDFQSVMGTNSQEDQKVMEENFNHQKKKVYELSSDCIAKCKKHAETRYLLLGLDSLIGRLQRVNYVDIQGPTSPDNERDEEETECLTRINIDKCYPTVSKEYKIAIEKCRRKLKALLHARNCAHLMLRLGWQSAGTYDIKTKTGGPLGTIRIKDELVREDKELELAVKQLELVKKQFPILSYADLYQLAGVLAVEVNGGPEIPFHPGREDKAESLPEGRFPDATSDYFSSPHHLREVFVQMGLSDRDVVALSGGCILAMWHMEFGNTYFRGLLSGEEEWRVKLSIGNALLCDPVFRRLVEKYAVDQDAFLEDYCDAHLKLSELGFAEA